MFIVLIIILGFFFSVLYEIWFIERNKVEILTLYSFLHFSEIKDVCSACERYLKCLERGSLLKDLGMDKSVIDETMLDAES
jgi:hypothetical protein